MNSQRAYRKPKKPLRKRKSPKKSLNKNLFRLIRFMLFLTVVTTIITCIVAHGTVVCQEIAIMKLHKKTQEIFMENNDKNLNVEFAKSIYNVNQKATNITNLHKPSKIIEIKIKDQDLKVNIAEMPKRTDVRVVGGY